MTPLHAADNRFYGILVHLPKAYYVFLGNTEQYENGSFERNGTATSIFVLLQDINPWALYLKTKYCRNTNYISSNIEGYDYYLFIPKSIMIQR